MKIKTLFAAMTLCVATSASAGDAPTLKDGVDAGVKAAIEAAQAANKEAKGMDVEWWWLNPVNELWSGSKQTNSHIIDQAITLANEGKNDEAKKAADFIATSAKSAVEQAQSAKNAGPARYGM